MTIILLAAASGLCLPGCGKSGSSEGGADTFDGADSIPEVVRQLVRVVAGGDSIGFARLVSYPLQRPYPLRDIENAEEMTAYYNKLIDDSLRHAVSTSTPDSWAEYGWRGWTLEDGRYIWIDKKVYDVQYISQTEHKMIDSLTREETSNIAASIREGWRPMACMLDTAGGRVYRIDKSTDTKGHRHSGYRLAVYDKERDLREMPDHLYEGVREEEGSIGVTVYRFSNTHGEEILLEPEDPELAVPILILPDNSTLKLKRAYWHELIKENKHRK